MNIYSLSPSMVIQYLSCPRKFYYNYVAQLPRTFNYYLAYGAAFHRVVEETHFQKIETRKDLPIDLLTDMIRDEMEYADADWSLKPKDEAKDEGVIGVRAYMEKVAPAIQPICVEHQWSMEIKNRPWIISGKTDLITEENLVAELKTSGTNVNVVKKDHRFQTGVYVAEWREESGIPDVQARIDYSKRGGTDISSLPVTFGDSLHKYVVSTFDQVARGIQLEVWPANRIGNYLCSRKYCPYFNACEADCGGRVPDC